MGYESIIFYCYDSNHQIDILTLILLTIKTDKKKYLVIKNLIN
jgi:hypothetical protein